MKYLIPFVAVWIIVCAAVAIVSTAVGIRTFDRPYSKLTSVSAVIFGWAVAGIVLGAVVLLLCQ